MLRTVARRRIRAAHSILEMLVSLVIGAILIAGVSALAFSHQRFHRDVVTVTERLEQLDQATALMPVVLRALAPGEGDIAAGSARDTSLEFRATIATAIVCDSGHGTLVLAPTQTDQPQLSSILARPGVGDTVWSLTTSGIGEIWTPRGIGGVIDSTIACKPNGVPPWTDLSSRRSIALRIAGPLVAGPGSPVRVTRSWRYSLYRASDGGWYLGAREWNSATLRFNTIQPVSGPFVSAASRGLHFEYFDTAGTRVPSGSADTRGIALIQVAFRVDSVLPGTFLHAIGIPGQAITSVALRNRPQ